MTSLTLTTRQLLAHLVKFDTTSRNSNLELIAFVEDFLAGLGIAFRRVDHEVGRKSNLYCTVGPEIEGGIVLSGHTDVVPVDGQTWLTDPFRAVERDNAVFGRGTADMKGFLASVLAALPHFLKRKLRRPIHLAFSCDEEVGCLGVRPLIAHMREHLPKPLAVIVGEPTLMKVVNAHKSAHAFETEVTGLEAHSSSPHHGVNAIMVAGELLHELNRIAAEKRDRAPGGSPFDPPYTTVHAGIISGGTARNIVPLRCKFIWETRVVPGEDPQEVPDRFDRFAADLASTMRARSPQTGIETHRGTVVPALVPQENSPAQSLALNFAQGNSTTTVSYATEAGLFQEAGISAIICGPGSIDQAHKPNEFIALSELKLCDEFMGRLADYCVTGASL